MSIRRNKVLDSYMKQIEISGKCRMGIMTKKKIAIVTGASSGMGRECVIQLADRFGGLEEIWVIARRKKRLEKLAQEVPVSLKIMELDLQDEAALAELEEKLEWYDPDVKLLVNGAGFGKIGKTQELSLAEETGMVDVNCRALTAVTRLVLPYMTTNSRILQFASAAAFLPQPRFAVYAATKAFVLSYSRALAMELRSRRIYVTAVCPGPVKTEFFDIAETTGEIPLYKRLVMADPKKVVKKALRDSMMGKRVSVYGPLMKAFFLLAKVFPHDVILSLLFSE